MNSYCNFYLQQLMIRAKIFRKSAVVPAATDTRSALSNGGTQE